MEKSQPAQTGGTHHFTRQVFLGTNLDTEHIRAEYEAGVLTLAIPVAEHTETARIEVTERADRQRLSG